jgi:gamma-glutamyl hydrolase
MGYENMVSYVSDEGWNVLNVYDLDSASLSLDFVVDPSSTKMYEWLGPEAYLFEDHNCTYNSHHWSMNPDKFNTDKGLMSMFKLTAVSYMPDGRPIVASIESEKYPFFGTQFHPEKPTRIFKEDQIVDHSWVSI